MLINVNKVKIVVAVPSEYTDKVRKAMCEAGAGVIGNYSFCTNTVKSVGTFIPNDKACAFIGKSNKLEKVCEDNLSAICDIEQAKNVIIAIRKNHPYEEAAIDIIPLLQESDL